MRLLTRWMLARAQLTGVEGDGGVLALIAIGMLIVISFKGTGTGGKSGGGGRSGGSYGGPQGRGPTRSSGGGKSKGKGGGKGRKK